MYCTCTVHSCAYNLVYIRFNSRTKNTQTLRSMNSYWFHELSCSRFPLLEPIYYLLESHSMWMYILQYKHFSKYVEHGNAKRFKISKTFIRPRGVRRRKKCEKTAPIYVAAGTPLRRFSPLQTKIKKKFCRCRDLSTCAHL